MRPQPVTLNLEEDCGSDCLGLVDPKMVPLIMQLAGLEDWEYAYGASSRASGRPPTGARAHAPTHARASVVTAAGGSSTQAGRQTHAHAGMPACWAHQSAPSRACETDKLTS